MLTGYAAWQPKESWRGGPRGNKLEQGASLSNSMKSEGLIPRSRLEGLTDGVFAFAMTLLVINIELPQDFHPKTNQELLNALSGLSDTFTAYLITFFVLVGFWSGRAQEETGAPDMASPAYARATLLHLLGVTFLPFSMLAVSRYDLAAAVWIYGANMIWLAVTALLISRFTERDGGRARVPRRTRQARRADCVRRAFHAREPVLARLRHAALSARSCLTARGARLCIGGSRCESRP